MIRPLALLLPTIASAPLLAATTPAYAAPSTVGSLFQVFLGLIAVLALIAGSAWVAKRFGVTRSSASSVIHVVSSASVGVRERVVVVEVGDTWLVVGVAPGSVNSLLTLPRGEAPRAALATAPASFAARFQQMLDKRNHAH